MLSIINHAILRCCHDSPEIINKAAYISQYTPWADMVIGLILCILGSLASNGVIPLTAMGASWMIGVGSTQIILGLFMKCFPCCKQSYRIVRTAIEEGNFDRIRDIFRNALGDGLPMPE